MEDIKRFKKISDYHKLAQFPSPEHPLISLVNYSQINYPEGAYLSWVQDYFTIGLKRNIQHKLFYGQQSYDFDEGVMTFIAPQQVMRLRENPNLNTSPSGWLLLIHPDFLWNTPLAGMANHYDSLDME